MNKKNQSNSSLIKKTSIYFAGNFSSKILNLIIIPIYANYLTANDLGKYDYQVTIANLLMPIIALAIWEAVLRFGLKANDSEISQIMTTAMVIGILTISLSTVILFAIYFVLYGVNIITVLYVVLISLMPVVNLLGYMVRAIQKSKVYALSGVLSSIINMISLFIFVIWLRKGLFGLLLSTILGNTFNTLYLFIFGNLKDYLGIKYFSKSIARKLITYSVPLIFNLIFGWLVSSFSRIYINQSIGSTENGIYAFASKFSGVVYQIANIVNLTMIEDAVLSLGSDKWLRRFEKNVEVITEIFFRLCFLLMPLIGIYYRTISNRDFASSLVLVPVLLLSTIFTNMSTLIGNIFSVYNRTSKIFITSLIGGLSNVVFAIVLGHFFGLIGIVTGQLFGAVVLVISRYILGQSIERYNLNIRKIALNIIIFVIISGLSLKKNLFTQVSVMLVVSLLLIKLYWSQFKYYLNKVMVLLRHEKRK